MADEDRDLDAEQQQFRARNWMFPSVQAPALPPGPEEPRYYREYVAQAYKAGSKTPIRGFGESRDAARTDLHDRLFELERPTQ